MDDWMRFALSVVFFCLAAAGTWAWNLVRARRARGGAWTGFHVGVSGAAAGLFAAIGLLYLLAASGVRVPVPTEVLLAPVILLGLAGLIGTLLGVALGRGRQGGAWATGLGAIVSGVLLFVAVLPLHAVV